MFDDGEKKWLDSKAFLTRKEALQDLKEKVAPKSLALDLQCDNNRFVLQTEPFKVVIAGHAGKWQVYFEYFYLEAYGDGSVANSMEKIKDHYFAKNFTSRVQLIEDLQSYVFSHNLTKWFSGFFG